ncbi:MAG: carbohydrate ABC transporter permease [Sphaerochaeta sp.]
MKDKKKIHPFIYVMILPMTALFFLFHTYPFLSGIFYSLTNWNGFGTWEFIGLENYAKLFKDPLILGTYLFTFKFALFATIFVNLIALILAVGLNSKIRFQNFLKASYFLPYMLGTLVISYVFRFFFANLLPVFADAAGIEALSTNILGTSHAWLGVLFVTIWQSLAFNTLIYLSGLQTINKSIYEAADLDGASGFTRFIRITFPMLAPFFTINMVLCVKSFLMAFDQIMGLTGGGPGTATTTIAVLIYKRGFSGGQFAYQSANSVILFLVVVFISLFQLKVLEKREEKYV